MVTGKHLLFLLLHLLPSTVRHHLADRVDESGCSKQVIFPRYNEYRLHCEHTVTEADVHWPCFSHQSGNLHNVEVSPDEQDEVTVILVKNGDLTGMCHSNPYPSSDL